MGDDWKEWDVLYSLENIIPPEFMWLQGDHENSMERRSARIREHYNRAVKELREGGYERLVTMKDRLGSHLSEVKNRLDKWKGRVLHSELQFKAHDQQLLDLACERVSDNSGAEKEEVLKKKKALLNTQPVHYRSSCQFL
jgi:hypothetical protein